MSGQIRRIEVRVPRSRWQYGLAVRPGLIRDHGVVGAYIRIGTRLVGAYQLRNHR